MFEFDLMAESLGFDYSRNFEDKIILNHQNHVALLTMLCFDVVVSFFFTTFPIFRVFRPLV